jgi:hypothetical protein
LRKLIGEEMIETWTKLGYRFRRTITLVDSGEGSIAPVVAQSGIDSRVQGLSHWYLWILALAAFSVVVAHRPTIVAASRKRNRIVRRGTQDPHPVA